MKGTPVVEILFELLMKKESLDTRGVQPVQVVLVPVLYQYSDTISPGLKFAFPG